MQRVEKWIITKKRPFHIDSDASTDQVFTLLDAVLSDNADEIDEIDEWFIECIAAEEIELTENPGNVSALRLEVNIQVVDQGKTHTKELETNKKRKKAQRKYPDHMETNVFSTFSRILFSWG